MASAIGGFPMCYGTEFIAKTVRDRIGAVGAGTAFIQPGSPWENGSCESFNSKLRDEPLCGEIFHSLAETQVVVEGWRRHDNTTRPHSSPGCRPPAPEVVLWPAPLSETAETAQRPSGPALGSPGICWNSMASARGERAGREKIAPSHMPRVLRPTPLAPERVEAILAGTQEPELTPARVPEPFPAEWSHQPRRP